MDQELRAYLDERFKHVDDEIRQARILIERQDGKIDLVAEGVANVDGKLERFKEEVAEKFEDVRSDLRLYTSNLATRVTRLEGLSPKIPKVSRV